MRIFFLLCISLTSLLLGQTVKFTVLISPEISINDNSESLNNVITSLNKIDDLNFVVICGNLTQQGSLKEFLKLKSILNKLEKNYYLLPSLNDLKDANSWTYFIETFEDKFLIKFHNKAFIGLSGVVPLTDINHYTTEKINWLNETLDTINLDDEIYLISPIQIDYKIDNWRTLLNQFQKKDLKLIINGNAPKTQLRNLLGYNVFDIQKSKKNEVNFAIIKTTNDSVYIYDSNNKIIYAFDKKIEIPKEKIELDSVFSINSEILQNINLNTTLLTSCDFWNNKIYTSDYSGLISCLDTTGKVLWEFETNGNIINKPLITDRMLAAVTLQGDLITLSAITGEQFQSIGFEDYITTDLLAIEYKGDKELMIPKLTPSMTALVFGTASGKIYCYDLETLQEYWVNDYCKEMITSKLLHFDNKIFYTSRDGFLYCIDGKNGVTIWRWKEKATTDLSYSNIICDGKKLFVVSQDGTLYAINFLLGKLDWKIENINLLQNISFSRDKKFIYAKSYYNEIIIINAEKGKIEKKIKVDLAFSNSLSQPIEIDNLIFLCDNNFIGYIDTKYNFIKSLFLGNAPIHTVNKIGANKFLSSNIDGNIVIFKLR
ncbi:MAG: PQQ-binding-like beta-propeller repeat protein [Melioribacter sp.]|nr:PQQ-binding-like beta-propeller repeat protein [Melioribacter sp.]